MYEGTTGIQALDLLQRKVLASDGKKLFPIIDEVKNFCQNKDGAVQIKEQKQLLEDALHTFSLVTEKLVKGKKNQDESGAAAVDYMMMFGYILTGYFLTKSSMIASELSESDDKNTDYLSSKVLLADYYLKCVLPRVDSLASIINSGSKPVMKLQDDLFFLTSVS